jgi:hypothetical protein
LDDKPGSLAGNGQKGRLDEGALNLEGALPVQRWIPAEAHKH